MQTVQKFNCQKIIKLSDIILSEHACFATNIFDKKKEFEKMAKKLLLLAALIIVIFVAVGCQTVQGLGGDITWTGEKSAELLEE
jgi:predicted small secreted protein